MRHIKRWFYLFILLFLWFWGVNTEGLAVSGQAGSSPTSTGRPPAVSLFEPLETMVRNHPEEISSRLQLARLMYAQSRLPDYLAAQSLLWAENNSRAESLRRKLPAVDGGLVSDCQKQLLQILERDPQNPEALLMAGDCQLFTGQKQTAVWYFHQAQAYAADNQARLALAEYYLEEWQPTEALQVLTNATGPEIALCKGLAYLELDDYPMAYGFLLEANPLSPPYQWTREKALFKAALALNVTDRVREFAKLELPQEPIAATLVQELKGWSAWQTGNSKEAFIVWDAGRAINPDYWFWEGANWYLSGTPGAAASFPQGWGDHYLDSNLRLLQGDAFLKEGLNSRAYQSYLAGIKGDHRSLVGFLKAGQVQLKAKVYAKAIDLFSQALAVNPEFAPILLERATAYQHSGRNDLATADRIAAGLVLPAVTDGVIQAGLFKTGRNTMELHLGGDTRNLTGLWLYDGKTDWKWVPWWGSPIKVNGQPKQLWVVPVGPGLSGSALLLENKTTVAPEPAVQPLTRDNGIWLQSSFATRMVGEIFQNSKAWNTVVFDQPVKDAYIPSGVLPRGEFQLRVGWQEPSGVWKMAWYSLTGPVVSADPGSDNPAVNNQEKVLPQAPGTAGDGDKASVVAGLDGPNNPAGLAVNYPQLLSLTVSQNDQRWELNWTTDPDTLSHLEILTEAGLWKEIPLTGDREHTSAYIDANGGVFCRIRLENASGRTNFYPVGPVNEAWHAASPETFLINTGTGLVNSRTVEVKPGARANPSEELEWALSNDLRIWSPWHQGSTPVRWRTISRDGPIVIFVRYRYHSAPQHGRMTVSETTLDTIPPQLLNLGWLKNHAGLIINLRFDEAVQVQATLTDMAGQMLDTRDTVPGQTAVAMEFPLDRISPGDRIQFLVRDQAGNITSFTYGINGDGLEENP